jgi:head-tail adaptor
MIVNSDLSQEIKDEYQEVVSAPVEERRSIKKQKFNKVTVNEMAALKDQIRLEARAARQAKGDLNAKRKMLAAAINKMAKLGSIKAKQAEVLLKRISTINLDNPVMVERFTDYAEKVFNKADYQNTLTNAFALRKSIRRLLKTDNQAQVVGMAREFAQIDPSMVEDIDAYIEIADIVKAAVKPTVQKGFDTVMKEAANIAKVSEYSKEMIAAQEEMKRKELIATYDYLQDISKDLSLKELQDIVNILKENQEANPDNQSKVMDFLKARMNTMAGILESMLKSGIDPITGEEIIFDENQKELMKRVLKIDLSEMDIRSAIRIVEGIDNFLNNQITSGLEAAASSYEGDVNAKSLVARGKVARKLKLFFSGAVGKLYSEQLFSLPNLMEKMFGGVNNSIDVMRKMGLVSLVNGVNKANRLHNDIVDRYSKQSFYSTKGFMDAANVYERGMIAFLKRNLIATESEMKAEFERRARIIKETIDTLREDGGATENKMADMYEEAYNKLGVDKMDLDVVLANASNSNLEAVDWWINEWTKYYQELSDVSLSVYNTMLGSDLNYTPDKYKPLSSETLEEGTTNQNGAFASDMNFTDKNKTGVLMESTRPKVLPKGRYISLDFDTNNSKALKAALVDINTAASIRQVDGFINSKAFKKLIPESDDRKILVKRINSYIRRAKGKNIVPSDTMQYVDKFTSYITSLGVGKALAGLNQTIMQTTPVMVNTMINAGRFDFATADFNQWLNETGMPISNRGLESQSAIESIDRRIEAKGQRIQETLRGVADLNQWYLKQLLVKPDVWVARSSFKSYYLQNLKRRGISTDIDWTNHEMDQEAAEYAQIMVDRQQNISDPLLAGEFLSSDNPMSKISRKIFLPFASFILNQKARMYNDLMTITSKTASKEDRSLAARSLAGLAAELTAYQALGYGIRNLYDMIASSLLGDDDEEEKNKKFLGLDVTKQQYNATKYPVKAFFNDIVSPLPIFDGATTWTLNKALEFLPYLNDAEIKESVKERNKILEIKGEDPMDKKTEAKFIENLKDEAKYQVFDDDFSRAFGMIGIAADTYTELGEVSKLAVTGEFTDEYEGRETLKKLLPEDKEKIQYTILPMLLYSTGLMPKDIGAVSKKYINKIKKRAITETQYDKLEEVQGELGRKLKGWEIDLVKTKRVPMDELNFIERNGGLTDAQGIEYVKLVKKIGTPSVSDIDRIKKNNTVDQILK